MSHYLAPHKAGLVLGGLWGLLHLGWSLLVLLGLAQTLIDWLFRLHMIQPQHLILPFSWTSALLLLIVACLSGYIIGSIFGLLWNALYKEQKA